MSRLHQTQNGSDPPSLGAQRAGDKIDPGKVREAISSIEPLHDLKNLARVPCARKSLLQGMATAAGVVGISVVAGRGLRRGLNWGVGSFLFVSIASWEACRSSYKAEQARMKTVIEGYKRNHRANKPSLTTLAEQQQAA